MVDRTGAPAWRSEKRSAVERVQDSESTPEPGAGKAAALRRRVSPADADRIGRGGGGMANRKRVEKLKDKTIVGVRAYARHRDVSPYAVRKAIKTGRLRKSVTRNSRGWPTIDQGLADREWTDNANPARVAAAETTKQRKEEAEAPTPAEPAELVQATLFETTPAPSNGNAHIAGQAGTLLEEQIKKTRYEALLRELEYRQKLGQLVSAEDVKVTTFQKARRLRDALFTIPERLAGELAATKSVHACRAAIRTEIESVLSRLGQDE